MKRFTRNDDQQGIDKIRFETEDRCPQGWVKTTIADLGFLVTKGSTPTSYGFRYVPSGINFVKIENIRHSHIETNSIKQFITKETHDYLKRSQLHADDILFSIAGTIGKVAIVHCDDLPANTNQAISIIRNSRKLINTKYLSVILQSKSLNILSKARGVGIYNVSLEDIKNMNIPLPPLPEQYRIVSKIESIFAQIDAAKQQLERLASQVTSSSGSLAQLKSSVLKQAFEGKLVSQDPNDESAEVLLKRLRRNSEKELKFDKEGLPEGWIFLPFGNIKPSTERFDPIKEENRRYVGLEHIEKDTGRIIGSLESKTTVSLKTIFCKGDLLYGKLRPYLNKAVVADFDGVCSTDILVFQQNPFIANIFLKLCLLKSDFVEFANSTATGVQHPRTSHKKLSDYPIPLPPLSEQHRIVSKIESIFGNIDSIEKQVNDAVRSLNTLKQSVLKLAFEGKLVPQDPNDEPASVLLEKIKLQKK